MVGSSPGFPLAYSPSLTPGQIRATMTIRRLTVADKPKIEFSAKEGLAFEFADDVGSHLCVR